MSASINDLADTQLAYIFKHLRLYDRLRVGEVSKRWYEISQIPWRDVVSMDLTPFRHGHFLRSISKLCPRLQNVLLAQDNSTHPEVYLDILTRISSLSSIKLYNFSVCDEDAEMDGEHYELFLAMFSAERLPNVSWDELVLHDAKAYVRAWQNSPCFGCSVVGSLPVSLKRLQLSGGLMVKVFCTGVGEWKPLQGTLLNSLGRLQNLTCLILSSASSAKMTLLDNALLSVSAFRELSTLKNLVELCVGWSDHGWYDDFEDPSNDNFDMLKLCFGLPKLEVLFLHNMLYLTAEYLVKIMTKHPRLRIVVLTGQFGLALDEAQIPARRLYPNGLGSPPLPLLHVFLGTDPINFAESSTDALKLFSISGSLSAFLQKEEIAPIFEGVWVAGQIKEGAKHGAKICEDN